MHVFIDDSGDAGVKFGSGSTTHLVISACVFREPQHIEATAEAIRGCSDLHRLTREFKYAKCKDTLKTKFFECIEPHPFSIRAIVIDKRAVRSKHLMSNPNDLKSYAIMQLLTHTYGTVRDAKVVIDGQDTKSFQMSDINYFMNQVNRKSAGTVRAVEFADSRNNVMVQLADMVAGAIHRSIREDDKRDDTHFNMIKKRSWQPSGSLWRFR